MAELVPLDEEGAVPSSTGDVLPLKHDAGAHTQPELGAALRRLRVEGEYTLADVRQTTGISVSFLSMVENGRSDITIGRLVRLLEFYQARIGDLLPDGPETDRIVIRKGEAIELNSQSEGTHWWLLAPDTNRAMMPIMATHQPGTSIGDMKPHGGEVFIHVLEGTLLFERPGHSPFKLSPGDSAYYDGSAPPRVTTIGDQTARLIGVVSPPTM